jgi:hypothetical protein
MESLKLLRLQLNVALKRLASAVQLRPWPPCFSCLEKAFVTRTDLFQVKPDPCFDKIRSGPRFADLVTNSLWSTPFVFPTSRQRVTRH